MCGCQECMCFFLNAKFSELLYVPVVIKDLDFVSQSHILVKMHLLEKRLNQLLHSICYGLMSSEFVAKLIKKVVILINVCYTKLHFRTNCTLFKEFNISFDTSTTENKQTLQL